MFYQHPCAFSISAKEILAHLPGFHSNVSAVPSVASESALMLSSESRFQDALGEILYTVSYQRELLTLRVLCTDRVDVVLVREYVFEVFDGKLGVTVGRASRRSSKHLTCILIFH